MTDPAAPANATPILRWVVAAAGWAVVLLGITVLIGWHAHLVSLVQLDAVMAPMQYNTALCFVLSGAALCAWAWGRGRLAIPILGGSVALASSLTLGQYIFQRNFGIDEFLFRSYIFERVSHNGRMSPVSALCFLLVGLSLLAIGTRALRWRVPLTGSLSSVVMSVCLLAVLGYLFDLPGTYGWGQLSRIALHTAFGFTVLGGGLFLLAWQTGRGPGERTPRWLPVPMTLGVLTATLVLYFALDRKQDEEITDTVRSAVESAKSQIVLRMDGRMRALVRMARNWEFAGRPTEAAWEADASAYVHDLPEIRSIEWVDASRRIRWVEPLKGNEGKVNLNLLEEPRHRAAAEKAQQLHKPVISRVVPLFSGEMGFVIYVPVASSNQFDGWIAVTINAQALFEKYFPPEVIPGEALRFSEDGQVLGERGAEFPPGKAIWAVEDKVDLPGATWNIRAWPTPQLARRLDDPLPEVVLLAGTLAALLLGVICALAQRSSRLATETSRASAEISRANEALRKALDEVKTLEGLLPICACCKRVRDDTGYWNQIESYVSRRTRASFSHGYCPECAVKTFIEFGLEVPEKVREELEQGKFE